jgi:hypothetical protein
VTNAVAVLTSRLRAAGIDVAEVAAGRVQADAVAVAALDEPGGSRRAAYFAGDLRGCVEATVAAAEAARARGALRARLLAQRSTGVLRRGSRTASSR